MTAKPLTILAPGLLALALLVATPARPAKAQAPIAIGTAAVGAAAYDDDYYDALRDYNENLREAREEYREAREEYYEDFYDDDRHFYRRHYRRGPLGLLGPRPVYPRAYVDPYPAAPYPYPPATFGAVPAYPPYGPYGYPARGLNLRLGPFGGMSIRW